MPRRPSLLAILVALGGCVLFAARGEESDRLKAFLKAFKKAEVAGRVTAVQELGRTWDAEVAEAFLRLMTSKEDPDVLIAIIQSAGRGTDEGATAVLKAALEVRAKDDWRVRGSAAAALVGRAAPGDLDLAVSVAEDKDGRVLQWLCDALATSPDAKALDALKPLLEHKDWRVRAAAIAALGHKAGSDEAASLLVARLRAEDGRLVGDLLTALKRVTGQALGPDPRAWAQWASLRKAQEGPAGPGVEDVKGYGPPVTYHGVSTFSRRIIFVFDRTGSMTQDDNIGKEKQHLIEVIEAMGKETDRGSAEERYEKKKKSPPISFDILMFSNGQVEAWQPALVPATEENKLGAISFIKRQTAVGWTNTWTAMKAALDMAKGGLRPTRPREPDPSEEDMDTEVYGYGKNEADTIFLLSDGAPTKAPGNIMDDWQAIADQIRDYNKTKRIVIHTVGIGQAPDAFMRRIADENGGTFVKVP